MSYINWTNITDLAQLPAAANTASGGSFWTATLYMVFLIILIMASVWGFEIALLVSAFLAFLIGFMMAYADLVNWIYVLPFPAIILLFFLYIVFSGKKINQ